MDRVIPQFEPSFGKEEADAVYAYMQSGGWITENKKTIEFEQAISKALSVPYVSCVNNGTISLTLALLASSVRNGDRVIVPDITMIATATAAQFIGVEPILVDLDPKNLCLDLEKAKNEILDDDRIKAVFYVALNGRSHSAKELRDFKEFCHQNRVAFIEDAAQAFGSKTCDDEFIGTIGDIGSFSFSPHKIVACGQGGALVTHNKDTYERIERLKDFGRLAGGADVHDHFGINSKFTDVQAVIGLEQLKKLERRIEFKKGLADEYMAELAKVNGVEFLPLASDFDMHYVPWFQDVYVDRREELIAFLKSKNIGTRALYPALHTQKILADGEYLRPIPVATKYAARGLWLPSSLSLTIPDVTYVCEQIREFYR